MADIKISELPAADTAHADDLFETSQFSDPGYLTKKLTLDQVSTAVAASDQITDAIEAAIGEIPAPDLSAYALINSPTFTGDPKAPTPATSDNDTSIATTAFTRLAIASFAPAPDLSAYALIASPTFTGDPKAPTPVTADNDTSIATTAYVKANIAAIPAPPPSTTVSATAPASPVDGQLWFFTDASVGGGNLYIRYNDGSSTAWVPASTATAGSVVQTVSTQTGAVATGTTIIPADDTIPQITEGDQYMTLAITPKSATSRLVIEVVWNGATNIASASAYFAIALFQDSTANALAAAWTVSPTSNSALSLTLRYVMTSGTTSATTFRVRAGGFSAGTTTFNGATGIRLMGGVMASSIVIQEVL